MVSGTLASKIRWRLILPTILFMFLSSLDRANVSFAALHMNDDLGLSPSQYGFAAGILFVGFLGGQYPSVLLLQRIGMRRWISGCAVLWGICAALMAGVENATQLAVLRVALGFMEGGLAPGIVLYLSQFATERERATTFAMPMLAIPLSVAIGGPLSGWLLEMAPPAGLAVWRWMFLAEATPTILLGILAWFYFPDTPADAKWLTTEEKAWLAANAGHKLGEKSSNDWSVLTHPLVWLSALLWFLLLSGSYGVMFWLPQILKSMTDLGPVEIGFVNTLPWIGLAIGIYYNSKHSDRTGERFWHVAIPSFVAAAALVAAPALGASFAALVALFILGLAIGGAQGAFWSVPTMLLAPSTLAVGAVAINIAGSSGGLVMPQAVGIVRELSGGFFGPTLLAAATLLAAGLLALVIRAIYAPRGE